MTNAPRSDEGGIVINPKVIILGNDKPEVILPLSVIGFDLAKGNDTCFETTFNIDPISGKHLIDKINMIRSTLSPPQPGKDARQQLWPRRKGK